MTDPSREVSIDAFGPDILEPEPEPPVTGAEIRFAAGRMQDPAVEEALRQHEQMVLGERAAGEVAEVLEQAEAEGIRTRQVTHAPLPTAIIYPSRTGGETPHVVTLALWRCTCEAAVLGNRECWAIAEAKRLFGGQR